MFQMLAGEKNEWPVGVHPQLCSTVSYPHSMYELYSYLGTGQGNRTTLLRATVQLHCSGQGFAQDTRLAVVSHSLVGPRF